MLRPRELANAEDRGAPQLQEGTGQHDLIADIEVRAVGLVNPFRKAVDGKRGLRGVGRKPMETGH
jgi:hypothetical protein